MPQPAFIRRLGLAIVMLTVASCSGVATRLGNDLSAGIRQHDDPTTVATALPAYLLLLDGLIEGDAKNAGLLGSAAELYGFYASSLVAEPERAARLSQRALGYVRRAVCLEARRLCATLDGPVDVFQAEVARSTGKQLDLLFLLGSVWSGFIQTHSDDWLAIAALPKAQSVLERVVQLDSSAQQGMPWVYLGVLQALRPPVVGGDPEKSRQAFERAIELSAGRNLLAKTYYAERYARLLFDRELHDRLVNEVLAADPMAPGLTLANVLAQQRARELQRSADAFF